MFRTQLGSLLFVLMIGALIPSSARAAGRTPPPSPDGDPQADECLANPGSNTPQGRVHNRFLWCQRWSIEGKLGVQGIGGPGDTTDASTFFGNFTAVGYGRDDGTRDVVIFFRLDDLTPTPTNGSIRVGSLFSRRQKSMTWPWV